MDRLALTVGFFFLVVFSSTASIALDVVDNSQHDLVIGRDLSRTFPDTETESATKIPLPASDKSGSEPATVVDLEPQHKTPETDDNAAVESFMERETESVPLTIISFRPIKRRFRSPGRTIIPFHRHHPCHHRNQLVKPWGPGLRGQEVPYGDDMLISGFKGVGPDPMFRGGARQIPARWVPFHPEGTRFPNMQREHMRWAHPRKDEKREEEREEEEEEHRHHHHHHHHHHHQEKNWFMGGVRKFLNQF